MIGGGMLKELKNGAPNTFFRNLSEQHHNLYDNDLELDTFFRNSKRELLL
ncbi:hypothetical protein BSYN_10870 [Bacteroides sedimenti]|uniref:Uncharacterized protein n=1 Tax=Bacteroides sedimenti TaxID=2136147 RepID=A0ABN6Z3Y0_9BACE